MGRHAARSRSSESSRERHLEALPPHADAARPAKRSRRERAWTSDAATVPAATEAARSGAVLSMHRDAPFVTAPTWRTARPDAPGFWETRTRLARDGAIDRIVVYSVEGELCWGGGQRVAMIAETPNREWRGPILP